MWNQRSPNTLLNRIKRISWIDNLLGYVWEFITYLRWIFSKKYPSKQKFIIFGTGRSGSTLLVNLLKGQENVFCDNEIFHRKVAFPQSFLKHRAALSQGSVYGFKCLTYQLMEILPTPNKKAFLIDLQAQGYKIIYLQRIDVGRQALSNLYARHTGKFHQFQSSTERPEKMEVNLQILDQWMIAIDEQVRREKELLDGLDYLPLIYEKDLLSPEFHSATLQKVGDYLGIELEKIPAKLQKITPKDLAGFIVNAKEVDGFLKARGRIMPKV